jgi:cobalamin synthase
VGDATLTDVVPTEYRADVVLLLDGAPDAPPRAALVVEVQLGRDADKRWSWPVYLASLRARLRCDVALLVVTPEGAVAGWAAAPIATGHPGWVLVPLVLGPDTVPVIRDAEVATRAPELAVLSVMLHGQGEDAVAVGEAALAAARGLHDGRDTLYTDLVLASVHAAARAILEAVMASGNYEYQSDFARRYFGQGKAEGKAEAVLAVLAARRIAVPDEVRARISACADVALLDRWLARAITAIAAADVVSE